MLAIHLYKKVSEDSNENVKAKKTKYLLQFTACAHYLIQLNKTTSFHRYCYLLECTYSKIISQKQ